MSDSIKKWHELQEEHGLEKFNPETERERKILDLIASAVKANKFASVTTRAEEVMKEYGTNSLLLGLEIATDELL